MFQELESRLRAIEIEITRLLKLAAEISDPAKQDDHLRLAQDLQREARQLRVEINKRPSPAPPAGDGKDPRSKNSCLVLSH